MDFEELIKKRRSVRQFSSKTVSSEKIDKVLEMANLSPSAGNLQARRVVIVKEEKVRKRLAEASLGQEFLAQAPLVFVVCANLEESALKYGQRGRDLYSVQDATIFASFLLLAIKNEGLDSCWVGAFREEEVRDILGLKKELRPVALIAAGFSSQSVSSTPRKKLENVIEKKI